MGTVTQKEMIEIMAVMVIFLVRDNGFTQAQAEMEVDMIDKKIGVMAVSKNPNEYLRMRRVGSTKKLNRQERKAVLPSLQNAINHGFFAAEYGCKTQYKKRISTL